MVRLTLSKTKEGFSSLFLFLFFNGRGRNKRKKEENVKVEPGDGRIMLQFVILPIISPPAHLAHLTLQHKLSEDTNTCCEWVSCRNQWRHCDLSPGGSGQKRNTVGLSTRKKGEESHRKQIEGFCTLAGPPKDYTKFKCISEDRVALAECRLNVEQPNIVYKQSYFPCY